MESSKGHYSRRFFRLHKRLQQRPKVYVLICVARDVNSKSLMYKLMQYLRAQIGILIVSNICPSWVLKPGCLPLSATVHI